MPPITVQDLLHLSDAERIQLVHDLWDSIPPASPAHGLTEGQRGEYPRRLAAHRADPTSAIPWEVVRSRLRERFS
jgi:putative addiction module component (TIGR02574 family)